ncbi:MAG: glycosyltransferase family 2 protein [Phycisphaerales bacterium]|nr:MAG: glycosyltransferase family 2 protein [Phycisphaerales bacterium]
MRQAVVSVIIPTYNREALLPRALDSVVGQTFPDWQIVLVDDGSTDNTQAVADRYGKRLKDRFIYIRQEHAGCAAARNHGIEVARGHFIAFLDSDDEYLPNKLERQLALFDQRKDLGLVYSDYSYVDLDGVRHKSAFDTVSTLAREVPCAEVEPGLCVCTASLFDVLIRGYFVATIVGMIRREVLGNAIRFREVPSYGEEWLFYLKVSRACRAGFVDEPLCLHHFVEGSITRRSGHRNHLRLHNLLKEMYRCFGQVSPMASRTIRENLSQTCRQLGFDMQRMGQNRQAFRYFAESLRYTPGTRGLIDATRAGARCMLPWPGAQSNEVSTPEQGMELIR